MVHHGRWGDHALLVQSALPVRQPRAAPATAGAAERAAMLAVAGCLGVRHQPYAGSDYARRLTADVDALAGRPEAGAAARRAGRDRRGPIRCSAFGAWHGDWNGGNSAALADGRVLVWDWERFDADVPVGYDALHLRLQAAVTRAGAEPVAAARALLADADATLRPFAAGASRSRRRPPGWPCSTWSSWPPATCATGRPRPAPGSGTWTPGCCRRWSSTWPAAIGGQRREVERQQ